MEMLDSFPRAGAGRFDARADGGDWRGAFPDTLSRMHAAPSRRCWACCWCWPARRSGCAGNIDVGMVILTGSFTVITAPVVANRVGQLAYREQNIREDLLTRDEMRDLAENGEDGGNGKSR